MWAAGIVSIIVALIFPMTQYENFLLFIGAMFMPIFGIVLTDYFIIRRRALNVDELFKEGGEYWYYRGFNPAAIISWAAGFTIYEFIAIVKYSIGGSIPAIVVAGLFYYFINLRQKAK